jgi:hypothetical protein
MNQIDGSLPGIDASWDFRSYPWLQYFKILQGFRREGKQLLTSTKIQGLGFGIRRSVSRLIMRPPPSFHPPVRKGQRGCVRPLREGLDSSLLQLRHQGGRSLLGPYLAGKHEVALASTAKTGQARIAGLTGQEEFLNSQRRPRTAGGAMNLQTTGDGHEFGALICKMARPPWRRDQCTVFDPPSPSVIVKLAVLGGESPSLRATITRELIPGFTVRERKVPGRIFRE